MKKFKKFLAILLVASMIFTTNAVNVFAEGMNANQEEQLNEETVETSEVETLVEADDETDEELMPSSEKESEEEFIEEEEEESVGANVHGARPEDEEEEPEETTVEAKLGESEIELELDKKKNNDQLYGDDPATPFAYWIVDGDDGNKTIHYYATAGDGRTAIVLDETTGVVYSGLDKESVKYAIIEDKIEVTDAKRFFFDFTNLETITGLSNLDTSKATSFSFMFHYCDNLKSLDLTGFNTSVAVDMEGMFLNCTALRSLDLSKFDTGKVRNMANMFESCIEITELDLTSFDTSSVTNMGQMFNYCMELNKIYVSDGFTVEKVDNSEYMFANCTNLEGGNGTLYSDVSEPYDSRYAHIDEGTTNPGFFSGASAPTAFAYWIVTGDGDNKTIHYYATAGEGRTAIVLDETTGVVYSGLDKESVKYAIIEDRIEVTDAKSFFSGFYYLETITGLSNLDTSKATSFWSMFLDCESLTGTLDVSTFDTSSLIYMHQMFSSCALLTSINFGDNFDTSNVTNMSSLFYACSSLQTITFGDKFKTNKVTEMGQMFSTCNALQSLDLTGFDTSIVVDMEGMFGGCMALTSLDLTSFDTSSVTNMRDMFASCLKLKKIYVSDGFTVENVEYSDDMFRDSTQLEGGSGTLYSNVSAPYDKTYAHIDEGETKPGLFSGAPTPPSSDKKFYIVYFADDDGYSKENDGLSEMHFSETAGAEAITQDTFDKFGNLSAAELRGFYKIDATDLNSAKSNFSNEKEKTIDNTVASLRQAYTTWLNDGAAEDVFYGALLNPYAYLFYYEGTVAKFEKFKCTDDVSAVTNTINLVKNNPPSGKKFKTWQYWVSDYIEFNPGEYYDFTDDGQLETYRNIATLVPEWYQEFETDEQFISDFNRWKNVPNINIHFGAIYEDDIFMYWKVEDDEEGVKTIYYYPTAGDGRTPVEIGTNGIVYNSLESLDRQNIKKAVFVDDIAASDVRSYFAGFSGLESITGLEKLDTSKATSFADMFNDCSSIVNLDVSDLKTDSLNDTSRMFAYCRGAKSIKLGNNFNTIKVTNMGDMFSCCNALESITFGSNFDTRNVTNMSNMFVACAALEELDLTKFDTSKVTDMTNMFAQCGILKTIKVSDKFKVDQVTDSGYMFVECFNLVGGKGTLYDETTSPWDSTYAHIDEGSTNPGFFTAAPTPTPPTPPTPSPTPSYGGNTGGGDSSGSSTDGPIKVTNNNMLTYTVNNIPQALLLNNPALYLQLMSYPENTYMQKTNAKDIYGNTGFGRWMRIPNTTTWYFYAGDFNGVGNAGFLKDGWFNLGWDGVDRWYRFDSNGVMQLGWFEENGKIYFLQNDLNDNWYGKAVTGTHVIDGKTYTFDSTGALIQ